jgi:hypothetical protein
MRLKPLGLVAWWMIRGTAARRSSPGRHSPESLIGAVAGSALFPRGVGSVTLTSPPLFASPSSRPVSGGIGRLFHSSGGASRAGLAAVSRPSRGRLAAGSSPSDAAARHNPPSAPGDPLPRDANRPHHAGAVSARRALAKRECSRREARVPPRRIERGAVANRAYKSPRSGRAAAVKGSCSEDQGPVKALGVQQGHAVGRA